MNDENRTDTRNAGPLLVDAEGMGVPLTVTSLNVGPGKPGPEDHWKIPVGPIDLEAKGEAAPEPARSDRGEGLLRRLTHRG